MALSPKQTRFIAEYLIDLNASGAARRAGYSVRTADQQGYELLNHPEIAAQVQAGQAALAKKANVTAERIVAEYALLGFANMADYITGAGADRTVDLTNLSRDQAAAISEMTVETYVEGKGDAAETVKRVKFKLSDKKAALDSLARHLGMFIDKTEITGRTVVVLKDV